MKSSIKIKISQTFSTILKDEKLTKNMRFSKYSQEPDEYDEHDVNEELGEIEFEMDDS